MARFQSFARSATRWGLWAAVVALALIVRGQGPLTPPGGPAATMRTLTQVEPRQPVNVLGGQAGVCQVLISRPGSYYLTANITGVAGLDCIKITTSGVSLDLNGFSLIGNAESGGAIRATEGKWVQIRNGVIRGWGGFGVMVGSYARLENLMICENGASAITVQYGALVTGCILSGNKGNGVGTSGGSIIRDCIMDGNLYSGVSCSGGPGQVLNCVMANNGYGYSQSSGGYWQIVGNTVTGSKGGVSVGLISNNILRQNLIADNDTANSYGVYGNYGLNRIEDNHVTGHNRGIYPSSNPGKEVLINNSSVANIASNYNNYGGNNASSAAPVGTTAAATNPYANISIP